MSVPDQAGRALAAFHLPSLDAVLHQNMIQHDCSQVIPREAAARLKMAE